MKKIMAIVMSLAVGFAATAQEEREGGFSAGLEFGIEDVGSDERLPYLMPALAYEQSFFDGALDVYAELNYTFGLAGDFPQSMYVNFALGYNLELGSASTLSFIAEKEFDEILISPRYEDGNNITGIFTPAIQFSQALDFGNIFARVGAPIIYIQYDRAAGTEVGLDFTIGWESNFGLELEAKFLNLIVPGEAAGFLGFEAFVGYGVGPAGIGVEVIVPREARAEGVIVTPELAYAFGRWIFYANTEFAGLGTGAVSVSPALGFRFRF